MTLPNYGPYLAGEDTLQYYDQIKNDTVTQDDLLAQKITAPTSDHVFAAAAINTIQGAPGVDGSSTSADKNRTPGFTSGATPA